MAKMKMWAVKVSVEGVEGFLFVPARRPGGAAARVLSPEGWAAAVQYAAGEFPRYGYQAAQVVEVRPV